MFIPGHHKISDPGKFWVFAQKSLAELPVASVQRIINDLLTTSMNESACIREADSIKTLDKYLRSKVFDWRQETYFGINARIVILQIDRSSC
jgi:hypothetical protein